MQVTRPDGSIVKGDGSFEPGSDTVTTETDGSLAYDYILTDIQGEYLMEVLGADGTVLATHTFTDAVSARSGAGRGGTVERHVRHPGQRDSDAGTTSMYGRCATSARR